MRIPSSSMTALAYLLLTTTGCEPKEGGQTEPPPTTVRDGGSTDPDAGSTDPDAGVPRVLRPPLPECTDHFDDTGRFCKYNTPIQERQRVVIRDTEAWTSMWQQLWSMGSYKPALPAVDFEDAWVARLVKLKVQRHERDQLARLPLAASAEKENPGSPDGGRGLATSSGGGGNRTRRRRHSARAFQNV